MARNGREVAEAFIDVHGDLSNFRKDLAKADADIEKLARQQAETFTDEWNKRLESGVGRKWSALVDAMYSKDPVDFDRLIGEFDSKSLDEANEKINDFLLKMRQHRKLTAEEYKDTKAALNGAIEGMRRYEKAQSDLHANEQMWTRAHLDMMDALKTRRERDADHEKAIGEDADRAEAARLARRKALMEEAIEMNRRYERSFEGMVKATKRADLDQDFRDLADAMTRADFSKFAKGFDSLTDLRRRVAEVTGAMADMGRITDQNADALQRQVNLYIDAEEAKKRAAQDALDAAKAAREEQERYNRSLEGMLATSRVKQAEADFRALADAMAAADFSVFTRGNKDIDGTAARLRNVADAMHAIGRVTDDQLTDINVQIEAMVSGYKDAAAEAENTRRANQIMRSTLRGNNTELRIFNGLLESAGKKMLGLGGLNVLGDTLRAGRDFFENIDRHAASIGKMTLQIGTAASFIGDIVGGLAVLADDAANLAAIGWLAPGFLAGAGIGIGVIVAAFKDMGTVLADLGPEFGKLQDVISEKFWKEAEAPIRNLVKGLLPTLNTQLGITATRIGSLFAEFATSFAKEASPERVTGMFEKMNAALDRVKAAVAPLVRAFVNLGEVGSKYFGRAADAIVGMAEDFDRFIQKSKDNGDLDRWIETAIEGFKDLGRAIGGISGIFGAISDAARAAGAGGLDGFANSVERISEVMNSERFQTAMISTFRSMDTAVKDVVAALGGLGPAVEAFLPAFNGALETVGETVATLIGYFGDIIANPAVQEGLTTFVEGVQAGVEKLGPAMGQIGTSLGGTLDVLGKVAEVVGGLISTFTVSFGPSIDRVAAAFADISFTAGPVIEDIIKRIGTIADSVTTTMLPPLKTIIEEAVEAVGKFIDKIGEPLQTAIDNVLPGLSKIADGFGKAIEEINNDNNRGALEEAINGLFAGVGDLISRAWENAGKAGPATGESNTNFWKDVGERFVNDFNLTMDWINNELNPGVNKFFDDFWNGVNQDGGFNDTVNTFFEDNVFKPIREGWDNAWKSLQDWWGGVKTDFQNWMNNLFGFGDEEQDGSGLSGASVGGRGMSVGGKIEEAWAMDDMSFMDRFKDAVATKWNEFWTGVQETLTSWGETFKTNWNTFWDGVGTKVSEIWEAARVWIETKATEIKTNVDTFITDTKTNWDNFWNGVKTKVEEIWNGITTWIDTKRNEIKTNIDNFIRDVKTNWDNFWNGIRTKVDEVWNGITTWIDTKVREIRTNIDNFVRDVRTNWDNFWRGVGDKVRTGWDDIVRNFQTGVDRAVEWVRSLPGKVTAAIGNAFGLLKGHGESIMNGFKQGLTNAWEGVKSFVGGIAQWIADHKGPISYDRVLLVPAGKAIMQGLSTGLKGEMGNLKDTLDLVTDLMADTITETFAASRMYAAGADAALGLAKGLQDNAALVNGAFDAIVPSGSTTIGVDGSAGVGGATPGRTVIVNIAEGAIPVTTPTRDPEIVAAKVIDEFAALSNF